MQIALNPIATRRGGPCRSEDTNAPTITPIIMQASMKSTSIRLNLMLVLCQNSFIQGGQLAVRRGPRSAFIYRRRACIRWSSGTTILIVDCPRFRRSQPASVLRHRSRLLRTCLARSDRSAPPDRKGQRPDAGRSASSHRSAPCYANTNDLPLSDDRSPNSIS